jgi:hypothetical protein
VLLVLASDDGAIGLLFSIVYHAKLFYFFCVFSFLVHGDMNSDSYWCVLNTPFYFHL